jgi:hypothetical protein
VFHVGPEFLEDVGDGIRAELKRKFAEVRRGGSAIGIIGIGDPHRNAVTEQFGRIEASSSRVVPSYRDSGCGIADTPPKAALAPLKIAGIFAQQAGHQPFRQQVPISSAA